MSIRSACPMHGTDGAVRLNDGDILRCGEGDPECGLPMVQEPTTAEQIVRDLAERGPIVRLGRPTGFKCEECSAVVSDLEHLSIPANQEPSCLWRRAREMYPRE